MFVNAGAVHAGARLQFDVCIVGAGAAGITIALELAETGARVCLLEAGGRRYDEATQDLLAGDVEGVSGPGLRASRLAAFGGSTGVWAGWCRPLDAIDFESRSWVPDSGWPFDLASLAADYARAHELCGLGPYVYQPEAWETDARRALPLPHADLSTAVFHLSDVRFGERYAHALARAETVTVILHAPVIGARLASTSDCVEAVRVRTLAGREFEVVAQSFVLAAGGIENARLLLSSGGSPATSPGNSRDLVGRYFSEHAFFDAGVWYLSPQTPPLDFYFPPRHSRRATHNAVRATFSMSRVALERNQLLNCAIIVQPPSLSHPDFDTEEVQALLQLWDQWRGRAVTGRAGPLLAKLLRAPRRIVRTVARQLLRQSGPSTRLKLRAFTECESNRDNRVTLTDGVDALGRPGVRVRWQLCDNDVRSFQYALRAFDRALGSARLGRIETPYLDDALALRGAAVGGKHHIGTTRMHADPARGVVNADSRVHGVGNLYVAGSSVFPTGGFANPTLTIVALSVRLARHLRERLRAPAQ